MILNGNCSAIFFISLGVEKHNDDTKRASIDIHTLA